MSWYGVSWVVQIVRRYDREVLAFAVAGTWDQAIVSRCLRDRAIVSAVAGLLELLGGARGAGREAADSAHSQKSTRAHLRRD